MLVLSRQRDETTVFDFSGMTDEQLFALRLRPIELVIVDIRGDKVRLGFDAQKEVEIHRKEVYEAKKLAAQVKP